ncbi:MAG TPA: 3-hydroxyacyl-CoA dehydrogenase family protein, partial [Solirubrobacteraceae bacterium]|nr:3-hydroxyacyl-CoA dehydrogenase family protein [Solirubrobacteraceae bacterium]
LLHDPDPGALAAAMRRVARDLRRSADRGRIGTADAEAAIARLRPAPALEDLAPAGLIVEAAPERAALKRELLARLSAIAPGAVLASNTSSIPITSLAPAAADPSRVVGMHFFNPAPVMRLVEVVAGLESSAEALSVARAAGAAMGKRVVDAADGPGFLVNRCSRPFGLEALGLLAERAADVGTIDRVLRLGGGFRMGPFELQDLVGIDVGFEVARSFADLSFGEPRWRPSPLSARMVAAGRLGRKTGRGWYDYRDGPHRPPDPPAPAPGGGDGRLVVVGGDRPVAGELLGLALAAGFDARDPGDAYGDVPWLALDCGADPDDPPLQGGPVALLLADGSLAALDAGGGAVGFHCLPPLEGCGLVELARGAHTAPLAAERAQAFFGALGRHTAWVGDAPGLVLGRVVAQLVNEAAFAVAEGVGTPADVDAGMVLGLNHPRGPLAWGDAIGLDHVLAILDALWQERREERYRAAPLLRRLVLQGDVGVSTGAGFHAHEDDLAGDLTDRAGRASWS